MIVRDIKHSPLRVVGSFDWFNDYDDTRAWAVRNCPPDVVALLDAGNIVWRRERNERLVASEPLRRTADDEASVVDPDGRAHET